MNHSALRGETLRTRRHSTVTGFSGVKPMTSTGISCTRLCDRFRWSSSRISLVLGAKAAEVNSWRARETWPLSTRSCAARPRRSLSSASPLYTTLGTTQAARRALSINSCHLPWAKSSARRTNSCLPIDPEPLGRCNNMAGIITNNFQARVSATTASPASLALNRSRSAKERKREREREKESREPQPPPQEVRT